jgi:hypothetical protein
LSGGGRGRLLVSHEKKGSSAMSNDTVNEQHPENPWALLWLVLKHRPISVGLVLGLIVILFSSFYFVGRLYDHDPLESLVDYVAQKYSFPAAGAKPDIFGDWEYRAVTQDGQVWGGDAHVEKDRSCVGISIKGERTWEGTTKNTIIRKDIVPLDWGGHGDVKLDGTIHWHYTTRKDRATEGFTHANLTNKGGVARMTGHFSEMSTQQPNYGQIELSRK